ncbi:MAG: DUF4340 domain-containing protein [Magnetococcales bacterium]|nr:DUF4340 domain-containing protein [Magnetococcales bacterium]MBF0156785.1 DUF4340 domain-containing protein [Magnetococcales bacterium]
MVKGWWVNLFLLAVLLAGGGGLWWADREEAARQEADTAFRKVSSWPVEAPVRMEFRDEKDAIAVLIREGGSWRLAEPVAAPADEGAGKRLVEVLQATYERVAAPAPVADVAPFGLNPPKAKLSLVDDKSQELVLLLGEKSPTGGKRYLRIGEEGPVVLVDETSVAGMTQSLDELRDKRLLPGLTADRVAGVTLIRGEGVLTLEKAQEGGGWQLLSPWTTPASATRVSAWIGGLVETRGSSFEAVSPPANPDWRLALTDSAKAIRTLDLWRRGEQILARGSDSPDAMVLYSYLGRDLDKKALELVSLAPWETPDKDPESLAVTLKEETLKSDPKEASWQQPGWQALRDFLKQEGQQGVEPEDRGPPWVKVGLEGSRELSLWKSGKGDEATAWLAVSDRPYHIQLSRAQLMALEEAVTRLFPSAGGETPPVSDGASAAEEPTSGESPATTESGALPGEGERLQVEEIPPVSSGADTASPTSQ